MNELLIQKLVDLVEARRITVEQIKEEEYKIEVKKRINK